MLLPSHRVRLRWRARLPSELEERLRAEIEGAAHELSEMEALLYDAHRATGLTHAHFAPSIELRLPIFDLGRRFRIRLTRLDRTRIVLLDEDDRVAADVVVE